MSNNVLRGRIVQVYGSQANFAKILGVSAQTVTNKCKAGYVFRGDELATWCRLLKIEPDGYMRYVKEQNV